MTDGWLIKRYLLSNSKDFFKPIFFNEKANIQVWGNSAQEETPAYPLCIYPECTRALNPVSVYHYGASMVPSHARHTLNRSWEISLVCLFHLEESSFCLVKISVRCFLWSPMSYKHLLSLAYASRNLLFGFFFGITNCHRTCKHSKVSRIF